MESQQEFLIIAGVDGSVTITPREDDFNAQVHAILGGNYDTARLTDDVIGLVHDEGLLIDLPMNRRFARLAGSVILVRDIEVDTEEGYKERSFGGWTLDMNMASTVGGLLQMPLMTEAEAEATKPPEDEWIRVTSMTEESDGPGL